MAGPCPAPAGRVAWLGCPADALRLGPRLPRRLTWRLPRRLTRHLTRHLTRQALAGPPDGLGRTCASFCTGVRRGARGRACGRCVFLS